MEQFKSKLRVESKEQSQMFSLNTKTALDWLGSITLLGETCIKLLSRLGLSSTRCST
jgi:hypothetical protein